MAYPGEESAILLYGGIDLHANNSVVVLLNEQDQVMYQQRLANHLPTILEQLAIMVKAGHKTGLQYHEHKVETYFILQGEGRLHFRQSIDAEDEVVEFSSGALGHVDLGVVHRVKALSDLILIESTTPDDGSDNVRLQDDQDRPSGRIEHEHGE